MKPEYGFRYFMVIVISVVPDTLTITLNEMLVKFYVIFSILISRTYSNTYNCEAKAGSNETELKCYLFSNFDMLSPPLDPKFPFEPMSTPEITMVVSYMDFNIEDGILLLIGESYMRWNSYRITWNFEKFGNQLSAYFEPNSIWKPDLSLENHLFQEDYLNNGTFGENHLIQVRSHGDTKWTTSMNIHTKCNLQSNRWPWDSRKCILNFTTNTPAVKARLFQADYEIPVVAPRWKIINAKIESDFHEMNIEVTFKMNVDSSFSQIALCSTFIAVNLVILSSFLIPSINRIKLASKILSLLVLLIFLVILMNSVPYLTLVAPNFVVGFILLLSVVGISSSITTCMVWFAEKSHAYHQLLNMEVVHLKENNSENDQSTDDKGSIEKSSHKHNKNKLLKMAVMIEYSSFVICLIIITFLTINFMI